MSRVVLHVGCPKTGTTFLQNVLWRQRKQAAEQGLYLPLDTFADHYLGTLDVRGLGGRPPHPPRSEGAWYRLVKDALKHDDATVLISHELYAAATAEQARAALARFGDEADVHVVITARDLLRQLTAEWQEHVKHKNTSTLEEFVQRLRETAPDRSGWFWGVQDYASIAERWGAALPPDRVHVIPVPPRGTPGDLLWERFAGFLGLDAASFDLTVGRSNDSLGREQAELLRQVNAALGERLRMPGPYPEVGKEVLAHRFLSSRPGTKLMLTPDDAAFAVEESSRLAHALVAAGVDVIGSVDDLVPGPEALVDVVRDDAYRPVTAEELHEDSVEAIAYLLVELSRRTIALRERTRMLQQLRNRPMLAAVNQMTKNRRSLRRVRGLYADVRDGRRLKRLRRN